MTYQGLLKNHIYAIVSFCLILMLALSVTKVAADEVKAGIGDLGKINDPVQDAKQAYSNGIKEFVGITLEKSVLIPGLKTAQEALVRKSYIVRSLNHRFKSFANIEDDPRRLYQLKRYANRYNMMMMKLIEQNELKQKRQYRY